MFLFCQRKQPWTDKLFSALRKFRKVALGNLSAYIGLSSWNFFKNIILPSSASSKSALILIKCLKAKS